MWRLALTKSQVANALMFTAKYMHADVSKALQDGGGAKGATNPLGLTGSNLFASNDYMSHQHCDHDIGMSVCSQTAKTCAVDEFNFAYTEWGVYIETLPNTVWCVIYYRLEYLI
jgi:hypothetical protein